MPPLARSAHGPVQEDADAMRWDRAWLAGAEIGALFYGIHLCVFCTCFHFLARRHRLRARTGGRRTALLLAYITLLFCAGTAGFATVDKITELAFVDYRNYPGGPIQGWFYAADGPNARWAEVMKATYLVTEILSNGLLLYRTWIVWDQSYVLCAIPLLLYLALFALGALWIRPIDWELPHLVESWFACAIALNVLLSLLIVTKLALHALATQRALHPGSPASRAGAGDGLRGVAAVVVESGALYAACSVFFIVTYFGLGPGPTYLNGVAWNMLVQVACIAPELIILRVARGHLWRRDHHTHAHSPYTAHASFPGSGSGPDSALAFELSAPHVTRRTHTSTFNTVLTDTDAQTEPEPASPSSAHSSRGRGRGRWQWQPMEFARGPHAKAGVDLDMEPEPDSVGVGVGAGMGVDAHAPVPALSFRTFTPAEGEEDGEEDAAPEAQDDTMVDPVTIPAAAAAADDARDQEEDTRVGQAPAAVPDTVSGDAARAEHGFGREHGHEDEDDPRQ